MQMNRDTPDWLRLTLVLAGTVGEFCLASLSTWMVIAQWREGRYWFVVLIQLPVTVLLTGLLIQGICRSTMLAFELVYLWAKNIG